MQQNQRIWFGRSLLLFGIIGILVGFYAGAAAFRRTFIPDWVVRAEASSTTSDPSLFNVVFDPGLGSQSRVLQAIPVSSFNSGAGTHKTTQAKEGDGETFRGVSLQLLVNELTKPLTAEDRAHVDLIVFSRSETEQRLLLPRALLVKFPGILLTQSKGKVRLVLPHEIYPKLQAEGILVETFGSREVTEIALTSYEQRYGKFLLKRRTDPAAMRGEKLYVQNCLGCHAGNQLKNQNALNLSSPEKMKTFLTEGAHPTVSGVHQWANLLDQKKTRSLASYISAFHGQDAAAPATP